MMFRQLTWGVKASFRSYVEAMEGTITLGEGVTRTDDGAFVFAAEPGGDLTIDADGKATGSARFQGSVSFEAHGGMLSATVRELGVEAGEDGLVLTAFDTQLNSGRCTIAELGSAEVGPDRAVTLGATITLDGMLRIADNYPPGTEMDPVLLD